MARNETLHAKKEFAKFIAELKANLHNLDFYDFDDREKYLIDLMILAVDLYEC